MKTKAKGTRREHDVIKMWEAVGAKCIRSAGSFGPFDIIVHFEGFEILIQVKSNRKPPPEEIEEMKMWPSAQNRLKGYCVWKDGESGPEFYWENQW